MTERLRRWRLVLGAEEGSGAGIGGGMGVTLGEGDAQRDAVLNELYSDQPRGAGLEGSAPRVARWLGDIRTYFPSSVVQVMQRDAMERLGLRRMLLEPEMLATVQPDVSLVGTLLSLRSVIPEKSKATARAVVRQVVDDLERRLATRTQSAITGALDRTVRTNRPRRPSEIDWNRTILANLASYQPDYQTIIPERLVGYGRRSRRVLRDIVLCIDQSGSMASSVVYSSVFGAVMASLPAVDTRLVVFDTSVVDLTEHLSDPVDVLFGVQLGGGTDIAGALGYCESVITRPRETILVLISDLYEGGIKEDLLRRARSFVDSGVSMIALLALSDDGAPSYDHHNAAALSDLGVPAFACTPDLFPDLMATAIEKRDVNQWAAAHGIVTTATGGDT